MSTENTNIGLTAVDAINRDADHFCVICIACHAKDGRVMPSIYHSNIYPYKQNCHQCGAVMVEGQSSGWPQLFDPPRNSFTVVLRLTPECKESSWWTKCPPRG